MKNNPERLLELSAALEFRDDGQLFKSSIVIGLFKKELDALRILRIFRANNPKVEFKLTDITNPYIITNLLQDKEKIY